MKILITGARAPVALELTRRFSSAGHEVHLTDSVRFPLAGFSRWAKAYHRLPPARQQTENFQSDLRALRESFDLLIPTCEDVLWVSQTTSGFCPDIEVLKKLHNKWLFMQEAQALGLSTPQSWLIEDRSAAVALWRQEGPLVFKPVYSRFATHTLINPTREQQLPVCNHNWVAQEYWEGRHLCSFSVAHQGIPKAHVVYEPRIQFNGGAGVLIRSVTHDGVDRWVRHLISNLNLTGQFAFDFIENKQGEIACLECNPRTTSGVHLFEDNHELAQAYLDQIEGCIVPRPNRKSMLTLAAFFANPVRCLVERAKPIIWQLNDPMPALGQALSLLEFLNLGRQQGFRDATTHDIAWDNTSEL